jgi:O-antigen/teichoic acid export membrane protein
VTAGADRDASLPRGGLAGGAAYGVLAVALEKTVALGIALYLPRHLGVADYGRYALLVSYLGFFQVLPDTSLEAVLVVRLARAGTHAGETAGRAALLRLVVSLAGAILGLGVLAVVARDTTLLVAGGVAAAGLAAGAGSPYRALLRARLRLGRYVVLLGSQALIAIALLAAAITADGGLVVILGASSVAAFAGVLLGRLLVGPGARLRADAGLGRTLVVEAWPLAGATLALVGAQQVLQLLVFRQHGASAVGFLGGAQKMVEAVGLLPQALMLSVLPALSLAAAVPGAASQAARDVARLLVIVLLPAVAALVLWAEPVLAAVLGRPFASASPVLRALAPAALLGATGSVLTNLLVAVGLQRALVRVSGVSALVMVALGVALVPGFGAVGAALGLVAGMLVGQVALLVVGPTRRVVGPVLAGVLSPLALGAASAGAIAGLGVPFAAGAGLLLVGYPAALLVTGTVRRADLVRWVAQGSA